MIRLKGSENRTVVDPAKVNKPHGPLALSQIPKINLPAFKFRFHPRHPDTKVMIMVTGLDCGKHLLTRRPDRMNKTAAGIERADPFGRRHDRMVVTQDFIFAHMNFYKLIVF